MIDKNDTKLKKGMDSMLSLRPLLFECARTLREARLGTWCAMDSRVFLLCSQLTFGGCRKITLAEASV